jgi:hypothetical protein
MGEERLTLNATRNAIQMKNTLVTSCTNLKDGLIGKVWLTVNGKWVVTYHDVDSGEQLQIRHECATRNQAEEKAFAFAHGGNSAAVINI